MLTLRHLSSPSVDEVLRHHRFNTSIWQRMYVIAQTTCLNQTQIFESQSNVTVSIDNDYAQLQKRMHHHI